MKSTQGQSTNDNHRFTTDRGRVDNCGTGSFFMVAKATQTEYLALSHSLRSSSGVITSGSAASGRTWPSVIVTQDESFLSKVFNPEVVFCSNERASLYTALNFREPN